MKKAYYLAYGVIVTCGFLTSAFGAEQKPTRKPANSDAFPAKIEEIEAGVDGTTLIQVNPADKRRPISGISVCNGPSEAVVMALISQAHLNKQQVTIELFRSTDNNVADCISRVKLLKP